MTLRAAGVGARRVLRPATHNAGKFAGKMTRSAPAQKMSAPDDGWGGFVASADPAADQRQGRPKDWAFPSFSIHDEAAWR